jgi:hypothetical protein
VAELDGKIRSYYSTVINIDEEEDGGEHNTALLHQLRTKIAVGLADLLDNIVPINDCREF